MENIIQKHRAFVAGQIEKSFDSNLQSPAQEVEKAYSVGDEKDFNGRTYYVHELNSAGQPKWRLKDKKTKADNEKKFKDNFKDASDEVLQKIVDGKIQASDHEKKWATDIINERKKAGKSDAAAKKIIDLLKTSNSKYTDIKKVVAFKTDKGNWAIDYDGANTGLILNGAKLSERELKTAGVKIEKPANDPRDKSAQDAGFKDYEEMRGYQNYVTSKNLLKKRSMQAKTKEDTKKELEANVAKYEKEHADVIDRIQNKGKKKDALKQSAFVTKTIDKIKDVLKYKSISDEHLQKLAAAISKDEATAKKIISVKFPSTGVVGPGLSTFNDKQVNDIGGGEEIICEASKSYVTTSRGMSPYTSTHYHMTLRDKNSGTKKTLSFASSSTGRYGTPAAKAKQECIMEAFLNYYKDSVYGQS